MRHNKSSSSSLSDQAVVDLNSLVPGVIVENIANRVVSIPIPVVGVKYLVSHQFKGVALDQVPQFGLSHYIIVRKTGFAYNRQACSQVVVDFAAFIMVFRIAGGQHDTNVGEMEVIPGLVIGNGAEICDKVSIEPVHIARA